MSPAVADLLAQVHAAGADLVVDGDRLRLRAATPLSADLLAALKARKAELLSVLCQTGVNAYRRRITEARSWDDLYAILADAEVAYAVSELTGEEVENLAVVLAKEARGLPDHAPECRP